VLIAAAVLLALAGCALALFSAGKHDVQQLKFHRQEYEWYMQQHLEVKYGAMCNRNIVEEDIEVNPMDRRI
jgi:hypothetical protein